MSTAAPAAPSPSATPAEGAAGPGPAASQPTAQPAARPIAPIRGLPGVFPDDDPFPPSPRTSSNPAGSDTPAEHAADGRGTPPRDAFGRFVAPSSATPGSGEHTSEPAQQTAQPDTDPAAPFEFAGERFATRAAAEQNFKTLRGTFKPIQGLAKSLGGVDRIQPKFVEAAESARGWKARAESLEAELAAYRSGQQPATSQHNAATRAQPAPVEAQADVDWELYAEVKKLATERGEPWKAEQWLIEQVREVERARIDRMLDERDAPLKAAQAKEAIAAQTETLFGALADYTNADGSPAFPELQDESAAFEIGRMWASLGLPRAAALTPQGAIAAIALYRMRQPNGSQARPATPTPPAQPLPPQPALTDTASAAGLTDGRPTVASVPGNGSSLSAEAAAIRAGLRSVHQPNRAALGFDA